MKLIKRFLEHRRRKRLRYHFIHIPKNGGNTVRNALRKRRDVSTTKPFHHRYVDVEDEFGPGLKYFCIIRNPWSRTASRYAYAKQNYHKWPVDDPRRVYIEKASFEDYVRDRKIFDIPGHPGRPWMGPMNSWFNQLFWILNADDEVACDCLRLEYLSSDICTYFGENIRLPKVNATKTPYDYRSMYDDQLAGEIAEFFKEDIDYFGFDFDSSATKNIATL